MSPQNFIIFFCQSAEAGAPPGRRRRRRRRQQRLYDAVPSRIAVRQDPPAKVALPSLRGGVSDGVWPQWDGGIPRIEIPVIDVSGRVKPERKPSLAERIPTLIKLIELLDKK